jgi:hypothetical protein
VGALQEWTGSFSGGFVIFALTGFGCAAALLYVGRSWEGAFLGEGGLAATETPTSSPGGAGLAEPAPEAGVS